MENKTPQTEFRFDENTPPKEIVASAMTEIAGIMKNDGFKFSKSKSKIIKKTNSFTFIVQCQSSRWNEKGTTTEFWINASVSDNKNETGFWAGMLAFSNAKQDVGQWELYGKDNYEQSLDKIKNIILSRLLPFFRRFEQDLQNLIDEVAEKGFCVFGDKQVYDANYQIPVNFLLKYGTKEQMNTAFQHYIDRHELEYVKSNMQKAIALLEGGNEVINNGEKHYAEFAIKYGLKLVF